MTPPNLLIIDSKEENIGSLKSLFASSNIQVFSTNSILDAIQLLSKVNFSVLVFSYESIDSKNIDSLEKLRNQILTFNIPILLVSTHEIDQELIEQGLELGISDFILRSIPPKLLRTKVLRLIEIDQLKKEIRNAQMLLRSIIDTTSDPIFCKDLQGRYTLVNLAMVKLLGRSMQEILGKKDSDLFPPASAALIQEHDRAIKETKKSLTYEERHQFEEAPMVFITTKGPLFNQEHEIKGVIGIARDVTQERTVQEERDRFFELSLDMLCVADLDGYFKRVNTAFEIVLGYTQEELLSKPIIEFVYPEDRAATKAEFARLSRGEPVSHYENRYFCKDGTIRWLDWSTQPFGSRLFAVARDITQQKHDQTELENSELRFRKLFEESPIAIVVFSPDGKVLRVNRACLELWNAGNEALQKKIIEEYNIFLDPQVTAKGHMNYIKKAFLGEGTLLPPLYYDPAESGNPGAARRLHSYIYPIKDRQQKVYEVILLQWDMTKQFQSETTLRLLAETGELIETSLNSQATFERIANIATRSLGEWCEILTVDEQGEIHQEAVAYSDEQAIEFLKDLRKTFSFEMNTLHGPAQIIRTGQPQFIPQVSDEILVENAKTKDHLQTLRNLHVKSYIGVPLKVFGKVAGVISLVSTHRHFNEQDLALAQELANRASLAMGNAKLYQDAQHAIQLRDDFLAVASHELRTPLTSLSLQIQSFQRVFKGYTPGKYPTEKILQMLQSSGKQLQGLTNLIEELFDISRIRGGNLSLQLETFDLSQTVREIGVGLSEQLQNSRIQLEIRAEHPIVGHWDRFRIEQVITNLLTNAMKYGDGKPIQIQVETDQDSVKLSVKDSGIGIAKEDQERIFRRFERAVPGSHFRGMGLGLYITKEIVELHQGTISLHSELGKGSIFTVKLPLTVPQEVGLTRIPNRPISHDIKKTSSE